MIVSDFIRETMKSLKKQKIKMLWGQKSMQINGNDETSIKVNEFGSASVASTKNQSTMDQKSINSRPTSWSGGVLEASWRRLGASWGVLEAFWGVLGGLEPS